MSDPVIEAAELFRADLLRRERAVAVRLLREYDATELEPTATKDFLRTRYMRLVAAYGLPPEACKAVAEKAWRIAKMSSERPVTNPQNFTFYND